MRYEKSYFRYLQIINLNANTSGDLLYVPTRKLGNMLALSLAMNNDCIP